MATDDSRPRRPCRYTYSIPAFEFVRESLLHIPDNDACLEWPRGRRNGYGNAYDPVKMRNRYAHQIAYELTFGSIPSGLDVLHKCDNRKCVNIAHLYVGTAKQNVADKIERSKWYGRMKFNSQTIERCKVLYSEGMTQQAIADLLGVDQTSVSRFVRGKHRPRH